MPGPRSNRSAVKFGLHWLTEGESKVAERVVAERMIRELHAARVGGDLGGLCRLFADQGRFEIVGASADKPIAIRTTSIAELRPWLAMMVKVFRLSDYSLLSLGGGGAPRPLATVPTDRMDLLELSEDRILSYPEFFPPRGAGKET